MLLIDLYKEFMTGWKEKKYACESKEMRNHLTEKQMDKMINDSFPASDPPSTY